MEEKNQIKKMKVETFADDMTKAIESGEGGVIKKIIEEQEQKENLKKNSSLESNKNKVFVIASFLLVLSAFIIFVLFFVFRDKVLTTTVEPKFVPMIFLDKTNVMDATGLTKEKLVNTVLNQISSSEIQNGEVEGIYLSENKQAIGFREFINLVQGNIPLDKITFLSDNFLIGINNTKDSISFEPSKNLFFLLQMRSISDVFPAMKDWENKMFYDFHGFFNIPINADNNYLLTKDFENGIVQNKNARILKDNDGNIVLMYVFVNDTSILITNSEDTSKEIITRLTYNQIAK